ncbi:hypothetical protein GPECTOR_81g211 [Gonium pectorale]|uniref:Uncharacterized protein n=1 Tax=Gonium pectorale TaxID=33097 RepID=A0A150G1S3_GONPE|nr:hypothetical protein GPECTOR_81g211 [Gonium pectorale]|eukprot:KXZ43761.1 hypothetical protein GPECTOR_81g211 [Gonium pectorale]
MNAYVEDLVARDVDHFWAGPEDFDGYDEIDKQLAVISIEYVYDVEVEELEEVEPHGVASAAGMADDDGTDQGQDDYYCPITLSIIRGASGCDICNGGKEEAVWIKGPPDSIDNWFRLGCPTKEELEELRQLFKGEGGERGEIPIGMRR